MAKKTEKKSSKPARRKAAEPSAESTPPLQSTGETRKAESSKAGQRRGGRGRSGRGKIEAAAETPNTPERIETPKLEESGDAVVIRFAPIRPPGWKPVPPPVAAEPPPAIDLPPRPEPEREPARDALEAPEPPSFGAPEVSDDRNAPPAYEAPADWGVIDDTEQPPQLREETQPGGGYGRRDDRNRDQRGRNDFRSGDRRDRGRGDQRGGRRNDQRGDDRGNQRGDARGNQRGDDRGNQRNDNRSNQRGDERGNQRGNDRGNHGRNQRNDFNRGRGEPDHRQMPRDDFRPAGPEPARGDQPNPRDELTGESGEERRGRRRRRGRRGRGGNRGPGGDGLDREPRRGELAYGPEVQPPPPRDGIEDPERDELPPAVDDAEMDVDGATVDFDALEGRVDGEGDVEVIEPEAPVEEAETLGEEPDDEVDESEDEGETAAATQSERGNRDGGRRRRRGRRFFRRDDDEAAPRDDMETGEGATEPIEIGGEGEEAEADRGRPAARKDMIINVTLRDECRIAIMENGRLEEMYLERASAESHVGNIYKGVVTNVEPSIQAAFIDFGLGKNGFLHISDLNPSYFPDGENITESVGRKISRRHRPPIQKCLRRGMEMLVQITKEGIGTKGPTLTTYLSIPGRFLVMMPGMRKLGVSRKIEDEDTRRNVREVLDGLELPDDVGFIARTAAKDRSKRELESDLNYLLRLWRAVQQRIRNDRAPTEVYRDTDLVIRTIRDVYGDDIQRIIVDDAEMAGRARDFLSIFDPRAADAVQVYDRPEPIFHYYGIEQELERLHSRHVQLKSGGYLVIDQAEALVAIDVNSGKFRTEDDAETTAFKMNIEAADEIARQLRLRDLGGVIVCDFIDMRAERHRREVERRLIVNLKKHKERAKILRMSAFGIIEMTRQRQRASLTRSVYQDCHHCRGTGLVKTIESVSLDLMRQIQFAMTRENVKAVELAVSPEVAYILQNRKRAVLHDLETRFRKAIAIKGDANFTVDQVQFTCTDHRGRLIAMT